MLFRNATVRGWFQTRSDLQTQRNIDRIVSAPRALLPLFAAIGSRRAQVHLRADAGEVPAGELGQLARFIFLAPLDFTAVIIRGGTRCFFALPRMPQDVAPLEIGAIARLLEDQILREMIAVVANMQARDEDVLRAADAARDARAARVRWQVCRSCQKTPRARAAPRWKAGSDAQGSHHPMSHAYSWKTARMPASFTCVSNMAR